MAIFGKKDAPKEQEVTTVVKTPSSILQHHVLFASVIKKPRITEKSALLTDKNVYTFEIHKNASKYDVRDAIKALYNVTPTKVHIVNQAPRTSMSRARGRKMVVHGMRKAYVYLKKGDRIELV